MPDHVDPEPLALFPIPRAAGCPFDPSPELRRRQSETPVSKVRIWDGSTPWLLTRHEHVRSLLASPKLSMNYLMPGLPPENAFINQRRRQEALERSGLSMDGPDHAELRRVLTPEFTVKKLSALRPAIQRITDDLIDEMLAGPKPADFVSAFATPLPVRVIIELLGVPYADREMFHASAEKMFSTTTTSEEAVQLIADMRAYFAELAKHKAKEPGPGLFSVLVAHQLAGRLTAEQVQALSLVLVVAGHDTTVNLLALSTLALLTNPERLAELRARAGDPELVAKAVEEMLRYLTVTHIGRRRAVLEDFEVGGHLIRKGDGLILAENMANRDPSVFEHPDEIDFHQQTRDHMAFGYGVHSCIGQQLARMELQAAYSTLHKRVPTLELAASLEEISFKDDSIVYGVYGFPVTWEEGTS